MPALRPGCGSKSVEPGLTVGLFDIGKTRTKEFLDRVELRLHQRDIQTIRVGKPTNAKVATPENLQNRTAAELDQIADAAIEAALALLVTAQ